MLIIILLFFYQIKTLTVIQYGRQMRHHAILETKSETESWLPLQHSHEYFLHVIFVSSW